MTAKEAFTVSDTFELEKKWLEERFNHLDTVLNHVRETLHELKDSHSRCVNRCAAEMAGISDRLWDLERSQAARNGVREHRRDARQSANVNWQMVIALASAASAAVALLGYVLWRLP